MIDPYEIDEDTIDEEDRDPQSWEDYVPTMVWAIRNGLLDDHLQGVAREMRIRWQKVKGVPAKPADDASSWLLSPGVYRNPKDGELYQVVQGRTNPRRRYAKLIDVVKPAISVNGKIIEPAEIQYIYVKGAVYELKPENAVTVEEAQKFGNTYGRCVACGKKLSVAESIERSMGPVCYGNIKRNASGV